MASASTMPRGEVPSREVSLMPVNSPPLPSDSFAAKPSASLASRATSVLSASYSDSEFRSALAALDERGVKNDPRTRRQIRMDLQKEVIDSNGEVIAEFGRVVEVGKINLWGFYHGRHANDECC